MLLISITTIPSRINSIHNIIDNIYKQSLLPDKIILNICKKYKRFSENIDQTVLDSLIEKYNLLYINSLDNDYGPLTKLVGCLLYTEDSNDIIITLDDDVIYPLNLLENLYNYYINNNRQTIYGLSALNFVGYNGLVKRSKVHLRGFNILEGFGGVIYSRAHFSNDFYEYIDKCLVNDYCFRTDDLIIHNYLNKKHIVKRLINNDVLNIGQVRLLYLSDGLCSIGTKNNIKLAVMYLKTHGIYYF